MSGRWVYSRLSVEEKGGVHDSAIRQLCARLGIARYRSCKVERLRGGLHTAAYRVRVEPAAEDPVSFVLRVYPGYPDDSAMCRGETVSLRALAATPVPAPGVWWSDPEGMLFGTPAIAIEFIRGTVPPALDSGDYCEIGRVLALLHRQRTPGGLARSMRVRPSGLTSDLAQCVDVGWSGLSAEDDCFLHGDLCAANTLFCAGRIAALIDWSHAAVGPPSLDVAAIWLDGELFGPPGSGDAALAAYFDAGGRHLPGFVGVAAFYASYAEQRLSAWISSLREVGVLVDSTAVKRCYGDICRRLISGNIPALRF